MLFPDQSPECNFCPFKTYTFQKQKALPHIERPSDHHKGVPPRPSHDILDHYFNASPGYYVPKALGVQGENYWLVV